MAKSLREKYAAAKLSKLKEQSQKEDNMTSSGSGSGNTYLKIENGSNKFRLFPAADGKPWKLAKSVHWLTFTNDDGTEGTYRGTVLNARVHAGQAKDVCEEYIKLAKSYIEDNFDKAEAKELIKKITTGVGSPKIQTTWECYAKKIKKGEDPIRGLLELKKTVRDKLDEASFVEDEDDPIEIDPFTCMDDGKPIILKYNKDAKNWQDYYKVSVANRNSPMDEEDFAFLEDASPLEEINFYTEKMFKKAINGLENFDEEHNIGFTEEEDWDLLIEDLKNKLDFSGEEKDNNTDDEGEDDDEDEEFDEEEDNGDEYSEMNRTELKKEIQKIIKSDKASVKVLKVKKSMSDEDIRDLLRNYLPPEIDEDEEEDEEEDDNEDNNLDAIKERLKNMK